MLQPVRGPRFCKYLFNTAGIFSGGIGNELPCVCVCVCSKALCMNQTLVSISDAFRGCGSAGDERQSFLSGIASIVNVQVTMVTIMCGYDVVVSSAVVLRSRMCEISHLSSSWLF